MLHSLSWHFGAQLLPEKNVSIQLRSIKFKDDGGNYNDDDNEDA